jgi:DNA-binding NarL/FixJ family response regulator
MLAATSEVRRPTATDITNTRHQRVLVAEDHPEVSASIRRLLGSDDFEVVGSVDDGARVVEEASRLKPDIVILDLNMPNRNGLDTCRELTRMLPRTRTIVVTAEDPLEFRPAALAAGAVAFVEKRAMHTDLLPAVELACHELAA